MGYPANSFIDFNLNGQTMPRFDARTNGQLELREAAMSNTRNHRVYLACALFPTLLLTGGAASAADEVFRPTTAITLPGGQSITSFDISFVDPVVGLYILGDRTNKAVDVVDTENKNRLVQLRKGLFTGATAN